jgi:hypothetical protein
MMISALLSIALGLTPVKESTSPQIVQIDEKVASEIGRYSQVIDKRGITRVRGADRNGRSYDLAIDQNGHVEGDVGSWHVSFDAADAS